MRTLGEIIRANVLTWVNAIVGTLFVLVLMAGRPADGLFVGIILSNSVLASRPLAPWKALLAGAMAASYLLMMEIDPLSDYFQLQPASGTLWWTIGVGVAPGGAVIVGIRAVTDRLSRTGLGPVLGGPGRVPGVPPSSDCDHRNVTREASIAPSNDISRRQIIKAVGGVASIAAFAPIVSGWGPGVARAGSTPTTEPAGTNPPSGSATTETSLPDYAPVPRSALGPALNDQGYFVGRVKRNLYWVTDGTYQSAFLTTSDGVVLLDAPPTIGNNIQRAVDEIAAANGVTNKVTHLIYSHHHADHVGASFLFDNDVVRIGHEETRRLLLRDDDPARPAPEETFQDRRSLEIGGERIDLAWYGSNHSPDNIYIHLPDHDTLMLVDIVNAGWVPVYLSNLTGDIPGYIEAPANALAYPWKHFIGGHLGRLGTRRDVTLHQQYMADIAASARQALDTVDPTPYFVNYGENSWAAVKGYLDAVTDAAAAPVVAKYTGVLAAADVFTASTTFWVMESIRLDLGYGSQVHP